MQNRLAEVLLASDLAALSKKEGGAVMDDEKLYNLLYPFVGSANSTRILLSELRPFLVRPSPASVPAGARVTDEMVEAVRTLRSYWMGQYFKGTTDADCEAIKVSFTILEAALAQLASGGEGWRDMKDAPKGVAMLVGGFVDGVWKSSVYTMRDEFWREDWEDAEPTHWMPLPTSPREEGDR